MQALEVTNSGLHTAPNPFSSVPKGAMLLADNCVIDSNNVLESRRGFDRLAAFTDANARATRYTSFQNILMGAYGNRTIAYYSSNAWHALSGSYSHPDATLARLRFLQAASNLYFTTSSGIQKLDTFNGSVIASGMYKGLDIEVATTGVTGFLTNGNNYSFGGYTANGSPLVQGVPDTTNLATGQFVTGTGISAGTTITSIVGQTVTLSQNASSTNVILATTGTTAANSNQLTSLASTTGIVNGLYVYGQGISPGTTVAGISGTTVTLSLPATQALTAQGITFFSTALLTAYTGNQVAYRQVWGIQDANKNIPLGAPTGRAVATNTATTSVNVNVTFSIPAGITTSHFYQVYRTFQSLGASIDPGDEEQLVIEGNPSSGDISAGSITVTDSTPDSLLGTALYTNASQQGITQGNEIPPLAWDFATFRNYTFYANTISKQRLTLTLLAAGGSSGVQSGDTLTIAGVVYTADSSENASTGHFKVSTSGTPAQNISNTAQSLVRVINQYASTVSCYAYYLSGVNDLPGMILLEERGIGGNSFAVVASAHGTAYSPQLPTSGTTVSTTNNNYLNGLSYSKVGQPEAVPLFNQLFVGSAAYKILRILPLQNSLLILKEVEGVFRLTGYDPSSFVIDLLDSSARLLAPDSAVVLNNEIWALTDQGITTISETGASVVSRPIEDEVLSTYGQFLSGVKRYSSGVAYETDRKYILLTVTGAADTSPTQAFVYNTFTKAFTRWPISKTCGFVNPVDDKLYLGDALAAYTNIERKTYSYLDYVDEGIGYTISSSSGLNIYLTSTNEISVGDILFQSSSVYSLITAVDPAFVTVQSNLTWSNGSVTVYRAISCLAEWVPLAAGNPGMMKQAPEISAFFRSRVFTTAKLNFASDASPYFESVPIVGSSQGKWGLFPWGTVPWGGASVPGPIRALVPLEKQRFSQMRIQFQIREGYSVFQLLGMSVPIPDDETYFVNR